jgi:hypothetical protein
MTCERPRSPVGPHPLDATIARTPPPIASVGDRRLPTGRQRDRRPGRRRGRDAKSTTREGRDAGTPKPRFANSPEAGRPSGPSRPAGGRPGRVPGRVLDGRSAAAYGSRGRPRRPIGRAAAPYAAEPRSPNPRCSRILPGAPALPDRVRGVARCPSTRRGASRLAARHADRSALVAIH